MNNMHEIIEFNTPLAVKVFMHKIQVVERHWHESSEILLVLDGSCLLNIEGVEHYLEPNDIVLINSFDIHSLESYDGANLLCFQVKFNQIKNENVNPGVRFSLNSVSNPKANYDNIKRNLAQLIKLNSSRDSYDVILMESMILNIYYDLVMQFQETTAQSTFEKRELSKLQEIIKYIKDNYQSYLSLEDLALKFHFSKHYFSRYFTKNIGITFKTYLDDLRFSHAMNLIRNKELTVSEIALESGFSNIRSFVKLFKERYNETPTEYRNNVENIKIIPTKSVKDLNYLEIDQQTNMAKIARFLDAPSTSNFRVRSSVEKTIDIDVSKVTKNLKHTFKNFISVGRAADILKKDVQDMLITIQKDIGFKYIKFHGIFDDQLMVFRKLPNGKTNINFSNLERIFDFILSTGLKPLVQLSFMPYDLAKHKERHIFSMPFYISEPNNMNDWNKLVSSLIIHLQNRYGKKEIESWLFSLWNEPETSINMFGFDSNEIFYDFYLNTYKSVKSVNNNITFGASSNILQTLYETNWMGNFLKQTKEAPFDFINIHFYPLEISDSSFENIQWKQQLNLSQDQNKLTKEISILKDSLRKNKLDNLPIYLTEWNSTTSHRDLLNDTAFKGAYIVKNIIDNYDELDSFGYWSLTDLIDELPLESNLFHGGLGLFTINGIKKPPYYGFQFLNELGDKLISKDSNHILTKDDDSYIMVLHNYTHYSNIYASGEIFDMTYSNRYTPFTNSTLKKISFNLEKIDNGRYLITELIVNAKHGSVFDTWINQTDKTVIDINEESKYLKQLSTPLYKRFTINITNNSLYYFCTLQPHEIRRVKITKII